MPVRDFSFDQNDDALGMTPDPVVEAYKRDLDRTLLEANLQKSAEERVTALIALQRLAQEARRAGQVIRRNARNA